MPVSYELVAGAAGLCLLAVALGLGAHARRRAVRRVRRALVDPDPATRRAAVFIAAEKRLTPYLDLLLERSRVETNETVLAALAEVVLRNQWETADSEELVGLRLWAQAYLETQEARAREVTAPSPHATSAATRPPARQPTTARFRSNDRGAGDGLIDPLLVAERPRSREPARETAWQLTWRDDREEPLAPRWDESDESPRPRATADEPPGRLRRATPAVGRVRRPTLPTVMVTGAGGPAGVAVIRALTATGHRVVAVDADGLAAGMRLADEAALIPPGDDPTFVDTLCDVASATDAQILVPTVTEELLALAGATDLLQSIGLATWVPEPGAVETCRDKWRFVAVLSEEGLPVPATNLGSAQGVPGAWVVKPRFGRGSRSVHFVDRRDDLHWVLQHVPEPIVQTRLSGREFTVDALVDPNGDLAGAVPRWRLETKAGISTKGRTFVDKDLVDLVADVLAAVGLRGPANVQGFMGADGVPCFIEVNPRFSGGLPLSIAAGADLVGEYLRAVEGEPVRPEHLTYRPGVTMIRHFEELFE